MSGEHSQTPQKQAAANAALSLKNGEEYGAEENTGES